MSHSSCILTFDLIGEHQNKSFYVTEIVSSLVFADVFFGGREATTRDASAVRRLRCILFEKRLCFKPKYIHFAHLYVVQFAFPSFLRRENQKKAHIVSCFFPLFFSSREAGGHAVSMVNDPFLDLFLVVKNPYDLRSHIRFWILPKKTHFKCTITRFRIRTDKRRTSRLIYKRGRRLIAQVESHRTLSDYDFHTVTSI